MSLLKRIDVRSDLFATIVCFGAQGILKLGSSMILTRILRPEAYGVITIIMSIVYFIEMLADIGVTVFIIRDARGEEQRLLDTAWSMRLCRAFLNCIVLWALAPFIASHLYNSPELVTPLRVISMTFVLGGLETMSFPLAIRRKRARVMMYCELGAAIVSSVLAIVYCSYSHDFWGILYSILLQRLLMMLLSWQIYRQNRPSLAFDKRDAREILKFTRFTMPSSLLSLGLSQFDKMVFLRLFDLRQLGVYGLAANMGAPLESLITKISSSVLYPRIAHDMRTDPAGAPVRYYTENRNLFASMLTLPAVVGGAAQLIVALLFPARYSATGQLLEAVALRLCLLSLAAPAEDLLIAAGEFHVILIGNILRVVWLVAGSLIGAALFGLVGFAFGAALSALPPLLYYWWLQKRKGMFIQKYEYYKLAYIVGMGFTAFCASYAILRLWPSIHLRT